MAGSRFDRRCGGFNILVMWFNICKNPLMWRTIDMRGGDLYSLGKKYNLKNMCRHAVDSSCGNLVEVKFDHFHDAATVLEYIADRLRSLRLVQYCVELGKVASKFPWLEYLEIPLFPVGISRESLLVVGRSCPLLKSLKLNKIWYIGVGQPGRNDDALAIAGTMHGLQHLQVFGNELTDEGLRKILDCCPRLVSLDLRYCFNLKLEGDLRMRCAEGTRTLWLPEDSIADYEFAEAAQDDVIYSELERRQYSRYINYVYDYDYDIPTYDDFYLKTKGPYPSK